jgi:hypothetical protein
MLTERQRYNLQFSAIFGNYRPYSYVKCHYFTLVKNGALQAASDNLKKVFPGANPRRGQERKEGSGARLGSLAMGPFCLRFWGFGRGRRSQCKAQGPFHLWS